MEFTCRICGSKFAGLAADGYAYCKAHFGRALAAADPEELEPLGACATVPPPGQEYKLDGIVDDIAYFAAKAPELVGKVVRIVRKAEPYMDDIVKIVEDPALPGLVQRVRTIRALSGTTSPGLAGPSVDPSLLSKYMPALDAYIWVKQHKWVVPVAIAAVVLVPGLIGFAIGRKTKKCAVGVAGCDIGWPPPDPPRCRRISAQLNQVASARNRAQARFSREERHDDETASTLTAYKRRLDALMSSYDRAGC
jgi:hypothetical protein